MSYPPHFTEEETENQSLPERESPLSAGREVQPRALVLVYQALPPPVPEGAPRPAGPGLSPCSRISHSSPACSLARSAARHLVHVSVVGHRLFPWKEMHFSSQSQLCSALFCPPLRTKLPAGVLLSEPPWPDLPRVGIAHLPTQPLLLLLQCQHCYVLRAGSLLQFHE